MDRIDKIKKGKSKKVQGKHESGSNGHVRFNFCPFTSVFILSILSILFESAVMA
jgi:hypothetical protein